jgi:hypothetical protein
MIRKDESSLSIVTLAALHRKKPALPEIMADLRLAAKRGSFSFFNFIVHFI